MKLKYAIVSIFLLGLFSQAHAIIAVPDAEKVQLRQPSHIVSDQVTGETYVYDSQLEAIVKISTLGALTGVVISDANTGKGPLLSSGIELTIRGMTLDKNYNRLLLSRVTRVNVLSRWFTPEYEYYGSVMAVDLSTGNRTLIYGK